MASGSSQPVCLMVQHNKDSRVSASRVSASRVSTSRVSTSRVSPYYIYGLSILGLFCETRDIDPSVSANAPT